MIVYLVPQFMLLASRGSQLQVTAGSLDEQAHVRQVRLAVGVLIRHLEHGQNKG